MKRRLFLKTGTVGVGGLLTIPTVLYGCSSVNGGYTITPAQGIDLFQHGAELFDLSIAELRISGSGALASAEAEDPDLVGIAEQIAAGSPAIPASLPNNFTESSEQLFSSTAELIDSSPEVFPFDDPAYQAELAEDFAYLKVVKASTLLASAAAQSPHPLRKVHSAREMYKNAELVHDSLSSGAEDDLIESVEVLDAYSKEYVGSSETFSAAEAYVLGVHNYGQASRDLAAGKLRDACDGLLVSADNAELSTAYLAEGTEVLNAELAFFGEESVENAPELFPIAAEVVPFSKFLIAESENFAMHAQGESAELGAEKMLDGSAEILRDAETDILNIGVGGAELDLGSNQYIAGEISYAGGSEYLENTGFFFTAAEQLNGRRNDAAEAEVKNTTELLYPASELYYGGAEALQIIKLTDGVESLMPAMNTLLDGAQHFESIAESAEAEEGAAEMFSGAELAEDGASEIVDDPAEFLEAGAESVEIGTLQIMNGAAEFIEGYI